MQRRGSSSDRPGLGDTSEDGKADPHKIAALPKRRCSSRCGFLYGQEQATAAFNTRGVVTAVGSGVSSRITVARRLDQGWTTVAVLKPTLAADAITGTRTVVCFVQGRLVGLNFTWRTGLRYIHTGVGVRACQLAVNIIIYALTQEGSMTQRLMQMVN